MSLYIVEDDYGNVLDSYGDFNNSMINAMLYDEPSEPERDVDEYGGHVVELVEAPAKVVVSEEEAEMLERAKVASFPAHIFDSGAAGSLPGSQDRLMRAYVNGYTVEKPNRYVLPMPGTDYHNNQMHGNAQYYAVKGTGNWRPDAIALGTDDAVKHGYTVTQSDIDAAPDWVKAITPVGVTDDGIR